LRECSLVADCIPLSGDTQPYQLKRGEDQPADLNALVLEYVPNASYPGCKTYASNIGVKAQSTDQCLTLDRMTFLDRDGVIQVFQHYSVIPFSDR
jgi:hypothetical protein